MESVSTSQIIQTNYTLHMLMKQPALCCGTHERFCSMISIFEYILENIHILGHSSYEVNHLNAKLQLIETMYYKVCELRIQAESYNDMPEIQIEFSSVSNNVQCVLKTCIELRVSLILHNPVCAITEYDIPLTSVFYGIISCLNTILNGENQIFEYHSAFHIFCSILQVCIHVKDWINNMNTMSMIDIEKMMILLDAFSTYMQKAEMVFKHFCPNVDMGIIEEELCDATLLLRLHHAQEQAQCYLQQ